jgi:hypothetical protein
MSMTTFEGSPQAEMGPSVAQAAPWARGSTGFVDFMVGSADNVAAAARKAIGRRMVFTERKSNPTSRLFQSLVFADALFRLTFAPARHCLPAQ